jgi:hypothetical protein
MKAVQGCCSSEGRDIAEHIERDPSDEVPISSRPVNDFLHLAVTAIAPLNGIGGRGQQKVIREG